MIIVLKKGTEQREIDTLTDMIVSQGITVNPIVGSDLTILGLIDDTSKVDDTQIESYRCVERIMHVAEPFKKANRMFHPTPSVVKVGNAEVGGPKLAVMAGPCSVEIREQITEVAQAVKDAGAAVLRGGAFKPRTSPYDFQGLRSDGIPLLLEAKRLTGLPVVSEILDMSQLPLFEDIDIIQVGARNMQNTELLKALSRCGKPILLKRGWSNTVDELLTSAEYLMSGGNADVILCERGIRTFETATRNTLDLSAVPVIKERSHLPVIVDPSHATGKSAYVEPMALAAAAAGADGVMIEVHNDPAHARCDGPQALTPQRFDALCKKLFAVRKAVMSCEN